MNVWFQQPYILHHALLLYTDYLDATGSVLHSRINPTTTQKNNRILGKFLNANTL